MYVTSRLIHLPQKISVNIPSPDACQIVFIAVELLPDDFRQARDSYQLVFIRFRQIAAAVHGDSLVPDLESRPVSVIIRYPICCG